MTNDPTPGVILARLDDIVRRLNKIDEDHDDYVLLQVYDAHRQATEGQLVDIRKDIDALWEARRTDRNARRQTSLTLAIAVIGWLVTIALAVITLLSTR